MKYYLGVRYRKLQFFGWDLPERKQHAKESRWAEKVDANMVSFRICSFKFLYQTFWRTSARLTLPL